MSGARGSSRARPRPRPAPPPAKPGPGVDGGPKRKAVARAKDEKRTRAARAGEKAADQKALAVASRALTGKEARYLRSLGHHLAPIVQIGKEGITDGVVAATRDALLAHELVKVRVAQDAPVERKVAGETLAERSGSALAQTLGRTLLLYKRHPHKPKIVLPE